MNNSRTEDFDMNFREYKTQDIIKDYPVTQQNFFINKKNAPQPI